MPCYCNDADRCLVHQQSYEKKLEAEVVQLCDQNDVFRSRLDHRDLAITMLKQDVKELEQACMEWNKFYVTTTKKHAEERSAWRREAKERRDTVKAELDRLGYWARGGPVNRATDAIRRILNDA